MKADRIWLIERLWVDPLENHNAYGYTVVGFVTDELEALNIVESEKILKSKYPWPLEYHPQRGLYVDRYKATEINPFC